MSSIADEFISDLQVVIANYERSAEENTDLAEIRRVADSALGMLESIRAHQNARATILSERVA